MSKISRHALRAEGEIAARDSGHACGTVAEIIQFAIEAAVADDLAKYPRVVWHSVSEPVPLMLHSPDENHCYRRLLLCDPNSESVVIGWFLGKHAQTFMMEGSPSPQHPTHWAVLPTKPA